MKNSIITIVSIISIIICSCKHNEMITVKKKHSRNRPKNFVYHFENTKKWLKTNNSDTSKVAIVLAVNRVDDKTVSKLDSILVPTDLTGDLVYYLPFPLEVASLKEVTKIILFSYSTQTFGAYENGTLVYTGPTSMGRKKDPTPSGLFFTNWKAEQTTSTFNDEWDLKWNFNIENKLGIGFHEYELPGYPASHSCLRLQEKDAKYLYTFADQWILKDKENIAINGTPVLILGSYDFDAEKPWFKSTKNPKALQLSETELNNQIAPFLSKILTEQNKRVNYK